MAGYTIGKGNNVFLKLQLPLLDWVVRLEFGGLPRRKEFTMRSGRSLVELAQEIERQAKTARDFIVPTNKMELEVLAPASEDVVPKVAVKLETTNGDERFNVASLAHDQLSARLAIPKPYYDRMLRTEPRLLATNVNHWLHKEPDNRMIRTLDGRMRAFLSNGYRQVDNVHVAEAVLPILVGQPDIQILSTEITERRMYIQAVTPKIQAEIKVGDPVQMGVTISNSEVGCGMIRVEPMIFRLVCLNGMIRAHVLRRRHVGKRITGEDVLEMESFYRAETMEADTRAFLLKVQDTVRHAFDELFFQREIEKMKTAAGLPIETTDLNAAVVEVAKKFVLSKEEGQGILYNLIQGGDLSKWGLANAVTSLANKDEGAYDRAIELQRIGGQVIDLAPSEWKTISTASA